MKIGAAMVLALAGCGYHFSGGGENIDRSIQKVYVETFVNGTSEAGIENTFRSAFIDQFIRGGRFKLVDNKPSADAVLKGNIKGLNTSPLSHTLGSLAAEQRMAVVLELVFETTSSGEKKVLWLNKDFSVTGDYIVDTSNANATELLRKTALTKLANDTAERAYSMMMSGF
jgi:outer membrane lipopolysaccharide assembly protein LptE/RlpB